MYRQFVALGDSVIAGTGDPYPGLDFHPGNDLVAEALRKHAPDMGYSNLGVPGATSQQIVDGQLEAALALKPDLVVFAGGANDLMAPDWTIDATEARIEHVLSSFAELGATLMTFTYADLATTLGDAASPWLKMATPRMTQLAEAIRMLSQKYDTLFIDYWADPTLLPAHCWSSDGVHLNALGYLKVAHYTADALKARTGLELTLPELPAT